MERLRKAEAKEKGADIADLVCRPAIVYDGYRTLAECRECKEPESRYRQQAEERTNREEFGAAHRPGGGVLIRRSLAREFRPEAYLTENHRVTFLFYLGYSFEALIYFYFLLLNPLTHLPLILVALLGHTSSKHGPDQ